MERILEMISYKESWKKTGIFLLKRNREPMEASLRGQNAAGLPEVQEVPDEQEDAHFSLSLPLSVIEPAQSMWGRCSRALRSR